MLAGGSVVTLPRLRRVLPVRAGGVLRGSEVTAAQRLGAHVVDTFLSAWGWSVSATTAVGPDHLWGIVAFEAWARAATAFMVTRSRPTSAASCRIVAGIGYSRAPAASRGRSAPDRSGGASRHAIDARRTSPGDAGKPVDRGDSSAGGRSRGRGDPAEVGAAFVGGAVDDVAGSGLKQEGLQRLALFGRQRARTAPTRRHRPPW